MVLVRSCHDWLCLDDGREIAVHHPLVQGDFDNTLDITAIACIRGILDEKNKGVLADEQQLRQVVRENQARAQSLDVADAWLGPYRTATHAAAVPVTNALLAAAGVATIIRAPQFTGWRLGRADAATRTVASNKRLSKGNLE